VSSWPYLCGMICKESDDLQASVCHACEAGLSETLEY
jgi:hypothetical protein